MHQVNAGFLMNLLLFSGQKEFPNYATHYNKVIIVLHKKIYRLHWLKCNYVNSTSLIQHNNEIKGILYAYSAQEMLSMKAKFDWL